MTIYYHFHDLPKGIKWGNAVAVDTEAMGLNPHRDRLCVVQLSDGNGDAHLVHFPAGSTFEAPNLKKLLDDPNVTKIFHFARFDVAILQRYLGVFCAPLFCTKIASKLVRTYTNRHGLKDLVKSLLDIDISKQEQTSDWGAPVLSDAQKEYAAGDVLYLHGLMAKLTDMLGREDRLELAETCFDFVPTRAFLDLMGWSEEDIFSHQ